jgi:hypothetical protein
MQQNPFTPPTEVADEANVAARAMQRPFKLYLPLHVAIGSFIGTPLVGFWMLGENYAMLGNRAARRWSLVAGVVVMAGLVALAGTVLEDAPPGVVPVLYTLIMRQVAASLQGKELVTYTSSGGTHTTWRAVGVGFAGLAIVIALGILIVLVAESFPTAS